MHGGDRRDRRRIRITAVQWAALLMSILILGSCEESTSLEPTMICVASEAAPATTFSQESFDDLPLTPDVLVVEESRAPGCQPWDWSGDHTACINATIAAAHRSGAKQVGLTRGMSYRYSDRIHVLPGITLGAVGGPSRARPILWTTDRVRDGIALGSDAELRNLDIRGPHYNITDFRVEKHGDWLYKGVNGATSSGWSILGTSVNGFVGTGILAARSHDIRIEGSTISHNGYSGVSLFEGDGDCGSGVRFAGNLVEKNGQDGIDTCTSDALFAGNTIRYNGWDGNKGDRHGILIFAWAEAAAAGIEIVDNRIYGNGESGIRISGRSVSDIVIRGNRLAENGHWGLDPGAPEGRLAGVTVHDNSCARNRHGCLNREFLNGVQVTTSSCFN